ncbi:MAG: flagellar basal body rod protein FlgB [Clostridiales bacterium]|nr:flagellar basal body rod protein FlgB [Clostridiales bacterium]
MFFQDKSFKTMETGVTAAWIQQQVHTQNIANYETPGYKAKSLVFSDALIRTRGAEGKRLAPSTYRLADSEDTTIRPDGNNVDMDVESLSLYKAYVQYSMLLEKIRKEINNHMYVVNNAPR